jgi:hypothetical protein
MAGQNTLIIASDYNAIQSKIALVLGSGSSAGNEDAQKGYGQNVSSSQVAANAKITTTQWSNLRNDILRARQHQTGTDLSAELTTPTASVKIAEADRAKYLTVATDAETNALTAPPPTSQATRADLVSPQVKNVAWNGVQRQTVTVTFPTADDARYFFNSGSQIEFSADRSGGTAGLKNTTWSTMLTNMGTIAFNYKDTKTTGTGAVSTIGWYNLTTTDNLIFEKDSPSATYAQNKYYIYARVNSTSDRRIGIFTIHFDDASMAPPSFPDPGFGIDENVDGTLISTVQCYRATGANVSVPIPSTGTTGIV